MREYFEENNTLENEFLEIAFEEIDGMYYDEAYNFLLNDAEPENGSVSGLIYYDDTEKLAFDYYYEMMEKFNEVYGDEIPYNCIKNLNDLTWGAWNLIMRNEENIKDILEIALDRDVILKDEE